jgi:selenophosphate synthetase-related protein
VPSRGPSGSGQLAALARTIQRYPGVTRKRRLGALTAHFASAAGARTVASFGEDCAVLELPSLEDEYLLFALDAIVPGLLRRAPRFAGYSSVLVNVLDIVAMGGTPIAAVNFLGSTGARFEAQVASGMAQASAHFGVPIVGGHLHPDDESPSLAVAILGRVAKRACTFSHTARAGDALVVAADTSGRRLANYPMAWSPLRGKSRAEAQRRFGALRRASARGLVGACKDASNPGIIGTFGMMLEASGRGGVVDVDLVPRPRGVPLSDWLLMYQGCGFVMAAHPAHAAPLCRALRAGGFAAAEVGRVDGTRRLDIARGPARATVFDFTRGGVTGIPPGPG